MKKYCFISTLLLCLNANATNTIKLDSVPVYEIINDDFLIILDSFINEEMQYDYYNSNVTFFIALFDSTGCKLELSSGYDSKNQPPRIAMSYIKVTFGICYYKTHSFIIEGGYVTNILTKGGYVTNSKTSKKIFKKTNKHTPIETYEMIDDENVMEDDRFFPTRWFVVYCNDSFSIIKKSPMEVYDD